MNTHFSITFRPLLETYTKITETFDIFLNDFIKNTKRYIISKESGDNSLIDNHLQIYVETKKQTNQKNITKRLKRLLVKYNLSKEEQKIALKVKDIKSNLQNVIGYPLKEKGDKLIYGFTLEEIEEYKKNYINTLIDKDYFRISRKNYHIYLEKYIYVNEKKIMDYFNSYQLPLITSIDGLRENKRFDDKIIKYIIDSMIIDKYYFTFLNSRNIIDIIHYIKYYMNKEVGYCDFLLDQRDIQG